MEFIDIPAGILFMGDDRLRDASSQHRVHVGEFAIGKFPVTNQEFGAFLQAGAFDVQEYWTEMGWKARSARLNGTPAYWDEPAFNQSRQPVVGVTWYEAVAFCNWLTGQANDGRAPETYRLATEAEWEYAARGAENKRNFPWGDRYERGRANTAEMGFGRTTPVELFPDGVSPFGVWDMSGNVQEWTLSKWGANWQSMQYAYPYRTDDGREDVQGSGARIIRGGSWFGPYQEALCAYRSRYLAGSRASNIGFRAVRIKKP